MGSLLQIFSNLFQDPPPEFAFEISEDGIAMARVAGAASISFEPLAPGTIFASPLRDNILEPEAFSAAVGRLMPSASLKKPRRVALILPDYSARIAVLDFTGFPARPEEQVSLIRFRMKKSVPFDIEAAALSYWVQAADAAAGTRDVVVAVTPQEIIARYEAPFRTRGLQPGIVTVSSLALVDLVPPSGIRIIARRTGRNLIIMVMRNGILKLVRSLELAEASIEEIASDLYPTFIFIEDNLGARAEKLLLVGFGETTATDVGRRFENEMGIGIEILNEREAGLLAYIQSTKPAGQRVAA